MIYLVDADGKVMAEAQWENYDSIGEEMAFLYGSPVLAYDAQAEAFIEEF